MKISKRLRMIAELVPKCRLLYDVGTDHAYLPIYLVKSGKAERAVASDISSVSADKALENVVGEGLEDKIKVRCGNGLSTLSEDEKPDVILISGMGGVLTVQLLEGNEKAVSEASCLILQPQHNIETVRKYTEKIGFGITAEDFSEENGKAYFTLRCERCDVPPLSHRELALGRFLPEGRNPLFNAWLGRQILKLESKISAAYAKNPNTDITRLEETLSLYKEVYEKCQNART